MDDQQLERALRSVGMGCFVRYFGEFATNSPKDMAAILAASEPYTERSCRSRVSHARRIIKSGRAPDALPMIANATNVDSRTREQAKALAT